MLSSAGLLRADALATILRVHNVLWQLSWLKLSPVHSPVALC